MRKNARQTAQHKQDTMPIFFVVMRVLKT